MEQINIYSGERIISRIFVQEDVAELEKCLDRYPHVFAVMDSNVAMNCPAAMKMAGIMNRKGVPGKLVDASEETKTMDTVMDICAWLLDNGADRDALVLAVGGGVTCDMVGFAASIYKRGVRFAYVPTTLLAQVDAAVGGKTGVNFDRYKNMLGIIRQQEFTYICPQVLVSLPHREFTAGVAEMLKTFIIEDNGNYQKAIDVLSEMSQGYSILPQESAADYWSDCVAAYTDELMYLVSEAVRVKAGIVSRDQFEKGERRKLNLGHTFAHAIETLAQREDRDISHGEAVAMGLVMAARLSDRVFRGDMETPTETEGSLAIDLCDCGLFPQCPYPVEEMAEIMSKDKKAEGGKVHFILIREIGEVVSYALAVDEVCRLMK
ncbi:MAG: 3-dehydroquinate synthase [Bacteroidales bacterium]|nr:3-dehydroquinate synthase [Bacteroidales bacterium]